jgi:hypothetical protein
VITRSLGRGRWRMFWGYGSGREGLGNGSLSSVFVSGCGEADAAFVAVGIQWAGERDPPRGTAWRGRVRA